MEIMIDFPGGQQVDAHLNGLTITTHQDGSAPTPFHLFLASMGTCAGIYVLNFCAQRGIPTEGVRVVQRLSANPISHMVEDVELEIQVPPSFPQEYFDAVVRAAQLCAVKKHLEKPPHFNVHTRVVQP